jgi:hypothetical protein
MRKFLIPSVAALAIVIFSVSSCKKEGMDNDEYFSTVTCDEADDSLNTYNLKISTILTTNCAKSSCHDAATHEEGKDFSTYSTAVSSFDDVLCAIRHDDGCEPMPDDNPKLSDADIHDLTCWAKDGFPQ